MRLFILTFSLILAFSTFARAEGKAKFQITLLEDKRGSNIVTSGSNGNWKQAGMFRLQFKILDESITKLDFAKIYFYNDKRELVDTLMPSNTSFLRQNNTISNLKNLDKNKLYNMEFIYTKGDLKWKYLIAILGDKNAVVAYVKPSGEKASAFDFPEKAQLIE